MKKSIVSMMLALLLWMGCTAFAEAQRTIVATTYPLYDIAQSVCGDLAQVVYAPQAAEKEAADADVLLCMGTDADAWADSLKDVRVVKALDGIDSIEGNADALTIPVNCMICASYFADAMNEIDPEHNDVYQDRLTAYVESMISLDDHIRSAVQPNAKISCPDGSMAYFAREYGLTETDAAEAIALYTYNYPEDDLIGTPYAELLHANLHRLTGIED